MVAIKALQNAPTVVVFFIIQFVMAVLIFGPVLAILVPGSKGDDTYYYYEDRYWYINSNSGLTGFDLLWGIVTVVYAGLLMLFLISYTIMYMSRGLYSVGTVIGWFFFWLMSGIAVIVLHIWLLVEVGQDGMLRYLDEKVSCGIAFTFILCATHMAFLVILYRIRRKAAVRDREELCETIVQSIVTGQYQLPQPPPPAQVAPVGGQWVYIPPNNHSRDPPPPHIQGQFSPAELRQQEIQPVLVHQQLGVDVPKH